VNFTDTFLRFSEQVSKEIKREQIEAVVDCLAGVRAAGGRLFLIGSGGGAGHASHAACDFRKLCDIESYAPYDNVSELTARVNDEGWDVSICNWLKVSRLNSKDCLFVFSVGGGNASANISMNLVKAIQYATALGAKVVGVVGKDGGYTAQAGTAVVIVPTVDSSLLTPIAEGFQAVIWHLIVSHPKLQVNTAKWESVSTVQPAQTAAAISFQP
jgi:D-sedoheptulose 7-phosphate isomerase